jgi:hypothetical protein
MITYGLFTNIFVWMQIFYLLILGLFNNAVSSSDKTELVDRTINE